MSSSITPCPSCSEMVLSDAAQCPSCGHVIRPEAPAEGTQSANEVVPGHASSGQKEEPCPKCGEMVRIGLVRCWNCGSFMRQEIADLYRRMKETPDPVIYSQLQEALEQEGIESLSTLSGEVDKSSGDENDFELSPDLETRDDSGEQSAVHEADDMDFDLNMDAEEETATSSDEATTDPQQQATAEQSTGGDDSSDGRQQADEQTSDETESSQEAHSVATGGDALLQTALEEEAESVGNRQRRTKQRRRRPAADQTADGIIVYCPNGCRVKVKERHRGKMGRCPQCQAMFIVPEKPRSQRRSKQQPAETASSEAASAPSEQETSAKSSAMPWLNDLALHTLDLERVKLKAGSLSRQFQHVDVGLIPEGLLVMRLLKWPGFGASAESKKQAAREAAQDHLRKKGTAKGLPVIEHQLVSADQVPELRVVQPVRYEHESMFAGVPVFGEGRIAIRLPKTEGQSQSRFLSLYLSEFRELAKQLSEWFGFEGFAQDDAIPLQDAFTDLSCHYTESRLHVLENTSFYEIDPAFKLKLLGWRCQSCQIAVSEDARKKEKIGGLSGRTLAYAKCPKCGGKFGTQSLYTLETAQPEASQPSAET